MTSLAQEHDALCHPDGEPCPDGCDAQPVTIEAHNFYCHACKETYHEKVRFFSGPLFKQVDGRTYPVKACPKQHAPGAVRKAYLEMIGG